MLKTCPSEFMIERAGLTRVDFTVKYGLGKNTMLRISQGRMQAITPRVEAVLWREWHAKGITADEFDEVYGTLSVAAAYDQWVRNRRVLNRLRMPDTILNLPEITPFARIVYAIGSISKAAQVMVLPDVVVQRYADGRQKQMPALLKTALTDLNYQHTDKLEWAQARWHEEGRMIDPYVTGLPSITVEGLWLWILLGVPGYMLMFWVGGRMDRQKK